MSLPFLLELHTEVEQSLKQPYSARMYPFQHPNYANVEGLRELGYVEMSPAQETLASYLSQGEAFSLKALVFPSKLLHTTSHLGSRPKHWWCFANKGSVASLPGWPAKRLGALSPEAVTELHPTTDLTLRATKQTAAAVGHLMAAMVVTERHLWLTLADIREKEKIWCSRCRPPELSVQTVAEKFREARVQSAVFRKYILCQSRSPPFYKSGISGGYSLKYSRLPEISCWSSPQGNRKLGWAICRYPSVSLSPSPVYWVVSVLCSPSVGYKLFKIRVWAGSPLIIWSVICYLIWDISPLWLALRVYARQTKLC